MGISQLAQIARIRKIAAGALPHWGLSDVTMTTLNHGENTTFEIRTGNDRFMMRVARPGYHSGAQLDSEIAWLLALDEAGFGVPVPVEGRDGFRTQVGTDRLEPREVLLFRWCPGRFAWKHTHRSTVRSGILLAELHEHASSWELPPGFDRDNMDTATMLTEEQGIYRSWRHVPLEPELVPLFEDVNAALIEAHGRTQKDGPRWLIHADLHCGNTLYTPEKIYAIDFDDCAFGHPAADISVVLGTPWGKHYEARWQAVCEGYRSVAGTLPFDRETVLIQRYARTLQMIGWLQDRARDVPKLEGRATAWATQSAPHFKAWLEAQ